MLTINASFSTMKANFFRVAPIVRNIPNSLRLSLTVGLCGGFTTFSTFSKDSLALIESGSYGLFAPYAAGSVALGIAATALGLWLAK